MHSSTGVKDSSTTANLRLDANSPLLTSRHAFDSTLMTPQITIAICTRKRPQSLLEVLRTLAAEPEISTPAVEILVLEDGNGEGYPIPSFEGLPYSPRFMFKTETDGAGLYESRRICARAARGEIVLYLDDDAFVAEGYLRRLTEIFRNHPDVQGVGGLDVLGLPEASGGIGYAYARLFHLAGNGPGRLSRSGFNYSQMIWRSQDKPFETDFLHGCNMAFRKAAIQDLPEVDWLVGHAPTEDLVISWHAAGKGPLVVDPGLSVRHVQAPGGRGNARQRLGDKLANHARFLGLMGDCSPFYYAMSLMGLFARDIAMPAKRDLGRMHIMREYLEAATRARSLIAMGKKGRRS